MIKVEAQAAIPVETKMTKEEEIDVDSDTMNAFAKALANVAENGQSSDTLVQGS